MMLHQVYAGDALTAWEVRVFIFRREILAPQLYVDEIDGSNLRMNPRSVGRGSDWGGDSIKSVEALE
jgi:hypothetical protein